MVHKIDGLGHQNYEFTDGNPATGTPSTEVTDEWLNMLQDELVAVLTAAGINPSKANNEQLKAAISKLIESKVNAHSSSTSNPHAVTKAQIGLGNLPNAKSDATNSNDSNTLATSKAVKSAYDRGSKGISDAAAAQTSADNLEQYVDDNYDKLEKVVATNSLTNGSWYTIAKDKTTTTRCFAKFTITEGLHHQAVTFHAASSFNTDDAVQINVLSNISYSDTKGGYGKLRILEGDTYDGCLLQVYVDLDLPTDRKPTVIIQENFGDGGWELVNFAPRGTITTARGKQDTELTENALTDLTTGAGMSSNLPVSVGDATHSSHALNKKQVEEREPKVYFYSSATTYAPALEDLRTRLTIRAYSNATEIMLPGIAGADGANSYSCFISTDVTLKIKAAVQDRIRFNGFQANSSNPSFIVPARSTAMIVSEGSVWQIINIIPFSCFFFNPYSFRENENFDGWYNVDSTNEVVIHADSPKDNATGLPSDPFTATGQLGLRKATAGHNAVTVDDLIDRGIWDVSLDISGQDVLSDRHGFFRGKNCTNAPMSEWFFYHYQRHSSNYYVITATSLNHDRQRKFERWVENGTARQWQEVITLVSSGYSTISYEIYSNNTAKVFGTFSVTKSGLYAVGSVSLPITLKVCRFLGLQGQERWDGGSNWSTSGPNIVTAAREVKTGSDINSFEYRLDTNSGFGGNSTVDLYFIIEGSV